MMAALVAHAPLALALTGVLKAAGILWLGPKLGLPDWVIAAGAALWITGPPTVAWLWKQRRPGPGPERIASQV